MPTKGRTTRASIMLTLGLFGATTYADNQAPNTTSSGNSPVSAAARPAVGLTWHTATYEAEDGSLIGAASIVGAANGCDRAKGTLAGEASHRRAVVLRSSGDAVSWVVRPGESGANAIVVRFSIPDRPDGGGTVGSLSLKIVDARGTIRLQRQIQLNSRYTWLYGGTMDGTKLYKVPGHASQYGKGTTATHLYDDIQLKLDSPMQAGDILSLAKTASNTIPSIAIDFVDLETVPPPIPQPSGFISLTDARCGGIPADVRHSGSAFDGADDSSYGSQFNAVLGHNPVNPLSYQVEEKVYYATNPGADALQDKAPNAIVGGLSMFDLADRNLKSLQTCVDLAANSGGTIVGAYVPPGRFYVRGQLLMPNNVALQGAGMWYTKFAAVNTEAPGPITIRGTAGIGSRSGNFSISSRAEGSSHVLLSHFAIFGNVTQRDTIDAVVPDGLHAQLSDSIIDNLWVEHTFAGLKLNQSSTSDLITSSRVRNVFADGIDFYGTTK